MKASLRLPAGLRVFPDDRMAALRAALAAVLLASVLVVGADWLMGTRLPLVYRQHYTGPLWPRTLWACLGAMREEVLYRLAVQTVLAALPALLRRRSGPRWMIAAIALAQLLNVGLLATIMPPYGLVRFWLVGCIWGWLYWKHGFVSALAGHAASHLLIDPLLLVALG